jgi:hypothetical protein
VYGVDFNDRLMSLAADGIALASAVPGAAAPRLGAADISPVVQSLREQLAEPGAGKIWVAVSPQLDNSGLGEPLRQLRAAGYPVQGFVDRAALVAAWLQLSGSTALLDLARHAMTVSLVVGDGATVSLRRTVRLQGGEAALHDAWVNLAAATLVQQTRFDPRHDQRQEAQLRQQLPALAAEAQRAGQGHCTLVAAAGELSLTLTRDQLAAAAGTWLQPLATALQSLSAAMDDCVLLMPESLLDIPGMREVLGTARFATVCSVPDGVAARAASALQPASASTSGGVQYLMRVPVFATAAPANILVPVDLQGNSTAAAATHVIYRGRALPIPAAGLVIGRDPGEGVALQLPEGVAGLSRRHCTLRRDGARAQVVDHSSFGSFVDGVRVHGRALLNAGSVLRLGEPGIELPLVALDAAAGSAD